MSMGTTGLTGYEKQGTYYKGKLGDKLDRNNMKKFSCNMIKVKPCNIASKINVTTKGVRLTEKLQLTATLCNEIWPQ